MSIDLSQFIPSFLEESFEGLELMEIGLLNLQAGDNDTINSIFRAAHSIKGGAGTFGFDHVTEFTHLAETLLDEMRDGRREISDKDTEILLESVDCMRLLIEAARDDAEYDEEKVARVSLRLSDTLNNRGVDTVSETNVDSQYETSGLIEYTINFIPELSLAKTGNDPLFLFSALSDLGELSISAVTADLPALTDIDVQELYLSWVMQLSSTATVADITEIFEWVEDECILDISSNTTIKEENIEDQIVIPTGLSELVTPVIDSDSKVDKNLNKKDANSTKPKSKSEVGSIRVGVDKVDNLINLVGELVITQSMLSELGNDFEINKIERLTSGLEQLLQNTKELQESVMRIRMLPISFAFNRFPRLVHDLAIKTGKDMELIIKGEQTELDKTVMEQIGDPLVHLVRNAADHGIESKNSYR